MIATGYEPQHANIERLEGALSRPLNAASYEGADVIRIAVLLAVAISQAQAFVDGNKRTGFFCMINLLDLNGFAFQGNSVEAARLLEGIADPAGREQAIDNFDQWMREHIVPIE